MNFTAKIKQQPMNNHRSARYKPNYILNVNIDIPLRPNQLMSDRPVSGEFTFSPSQLKKKLKLQLPYNSTRTTRDIESRKISSNLGDTQNTISCLNHNKKKKITTNSSSYGHPYCLSANPSRKHHPKNKSESVSPKKKNSLLNSTSNNNSNMISSAQNSRLHCHNKNLNSITSHGNIKDNKMIKKLACLSISQSQDNIIKYTNNSSELQRDTSRNKDRQRGNYQRLFTSNLSVYDNDKNIKQKNDNNLIGLTFKTTEIENEDYMLMTEIRQFQRKSQEKKEHLNYLYVKEKILVLASVKKIQRAWRNYKTKKLLKSYSNNISLRLTKKIQGICSSDRPSILTVRSLGNQDFKKRKYNIDAYKEHGFAVGSQDKKLRQVATARHVSNKYEIDEQESVKNEEVISAQARFQMQEIQRWEELIKNIRQGKQVEQVLEKSCKRKQQLEKQLIGYNKPKNEEIKNLTKQPLNNAHNQQKHKNFRFFDDQYPEKKSREKDQSIIQNKNHRKSRSFGFGSDISDKPVFIDYDEYENSSISNSIKSKQKYANFLKKQSKGDYHKPSQSLDQQNSQSSQSQQFMTINSEKLIQSPIPHRSEECGNTTKRNRQKLQQFQNEIRRIDNEDSSMSESLNYQNTHYHTIKEEQSPEASLENQNSKMTAAQREQLENQKLRRKLLLLNQIDFKGFEESQGTVLKKPTVIVPKIENLQSIKKQSIIQDQGPLSSSQRLQLQVILEQKQQKPQMKSQFHEYVKQQESQYLDEDQYKLQTYRQVTLKESNREDFDLQSAQKVNKFILPVIHKTIKASVEEKNQLCIKLEEQLIYQCLLEFSESDSIVCKFKGIYENRLRNRNNQEQKPEGICTNLQSIKDYLQNLVAFIFQQYPDIFQQGLQTNYFSLNSTTLMHYFRGQTTLNHALKGNNRYVLSEQLFNQHWAYASQQIYFDPKYPDNEEKEAERVKYLKSITKIYFTSIFSGFNECLQQFCPLYPCYALVNKYSDLHLNTLFRLIQKIEAIPNSQSDAMQQKIIVRNAYKKLSTFAVVYCGLHLEDKNHTMSPQMAKQIQEQRLATLLEVQIGEQQYTGWSSVEPIMCYALTVFKVAEIIMESVTQEAVLQIGQLFTK